MPGLKPSRAESSRKECELEEEGWAIEEITRAASLSPSRPRSAEEGNFQGAEGGDGGGFPLENGAGTQNFALSAFE